MADTETVARLGAGGRFVIPASYRKALGLRPGDMLVLRMEDGELWVSTRDRAIKRVQAYVRRYVPSGVSLVDELIHERREEALRE
jgi:AbrB family looped-hinge helix DNA binding protein